MTPEEVRAEIARLGAAYPPIVRVGPFDWGPFLDDMRARAADVRRAMGDLAQVWRAQHERLLRTWRTFGQILREAANSEVRVSGLEARYYARGALECVTDDDIDCLVKDLLREPEATAPDDGLMGLLTVGSRARLAAAALAGHAAHRPVEEDVRFLVWYRLVGSTALEVRML